MAEGAIIRDVIAPLPNAGGRSAPLYIAFLDALSGKGFRGEIDTGFAGRSVLATDNSIYRLLPQAVVYPRDADDVRRLARLIAEPRFREVVVAPRGGGTGTNGQSLTDGIVVDLSRHMNRILEINVEERWVRVECGVVKDQLNRELARHGFFFAPELSTSNRATIGGMISTDASGQGSCTYGKTRDHVLSLDCILPGGDRLRTAPLAGEALDAQCRRDDGVGRVWRTARSVAQEKAALIEATFPPLNRCLTGYDLAHLLDGEGRLDPASVLCGSEGSLGFIVEAKLNVLPIPRHAVLVNVRYASFMDALRDAQALMACRPLSIETIDSKVLTLAMQDIVWDGVAEYFPADPGRATLGINLVEFSGDDAAELDRRVDAFLDHLASDRTASRLGATLARGIHAVEKVYAMRKRAVGLLGNVKGEARPQAFVEDTAVPPENLAEFIAQFRALLDGYGLDYGMFGHVDAGVLHVRPALDLKNPAHVALIRPLSDAVVDLTRRHGGLLWGEHGKGVRSEYGPAYFGELYPALQDIKAAFDPFNQLNPGKIATPAGSRAALMKVDGVPLRGSLDGAIDQRVWRANGAAMHCNGNGACYNFDPDDAMCPSWKATRMRIHSPKGRATLIKEWLRLQQEAGVDVLAAARRRASPLTVFGKTTRRSVPDDFSHEVYDAMAGCLACKSCAAQCPVKVNVPDFRSRFLDLYHRRYARPARDRLIGALETVIPYAARWPALYNGMLRRRATRVLMERRIGMVDAPEISRFRLRDVLDRWSVEVATPRLLASLSDAERVRSVVLVQDAFTRYFDTEVFAAFVELAARLGQRVFLAPFRANGKPLHVNGFLAAFDRTATRNANGLRRLAACGIPLVGFDPAMTLVYRQEYRSVTDIGDVPDVELPQEWLLRVMPALPSDGAAFRLLGHCTERTSVPDSGRKWQLAFERFGMVLRTPPVGCCGMSGTYGHEARNAETSRVIFSQSWQPLVEGRVDEGEALATGYSCRSQVKRLADRRLRHPVEVLRDRLRDEQDVGRVSAPSHLPSRG